MSFETITVTAETAARLAKRAFDYRLEAIAFSKLETESSAMQAIKADAQAYEIERILSELDLWEFARKAAGITSVK